MKGIATINQLLKQPAATGEPLVRNIRSHKIQASHLERLAIVYVRQSRPHQICEHQESLARQYELAHHAQVLGWQQPRVLVIDDDQGLSGRSIDLRLGFQRLLTEVTMERVGLILGLEMSRLARSSKDWHHLLELCAMFGTLLADQDGIYNPSDSNDRLLLGLKGTMSEFEMFTMRNRLQRGTLHKAERGELFIATPRGYLKLPTGELVQDPDEQVREVIQLIFSKFDEIGTVCGLLRYLIHNNIMLGGRTHQGPRRGEVEWKRPCRSSLFKILHHPVYAGAYTFGRKPYESNPLDGQLAQRNERPDDQWKILIRDRLPAYISWEKYVANRKRLSQNRNLLKSPGVPRSGPALLAGLIYCGRCGRRMTVRYRHRDHPYYRCERHLELVVDQSCHGLNASGVDALLAQQVQKVLEPAALTLHLQVLEDSQQERKRLESHWAKRLERARYECERAERQYQAVEPENRLVARTLERKWDEALAALRQLQDDYEQFTREQPLRLSEEEQKRILSLSQDIPTLWHAEGTTVEDRKDIIRCLVEKISVTVHHPSERVTVTIHWQGGNVSEHETVRTVQSYLQLAQADRLKVRIVKLRKDGISATQIAKQLNEEGFSSRRPGIPFSEHQVVHLLELLGQTKKRDVVSLDQHEWQIGKLAQTLEIGREKLREWYSKGWVHGRQTPTSKLCIIWADADELKRLRCLQKNSKLGVSNHPRELTKPKKRPKSNKC